ncbi:MAG TPA: phenylalanine--tRNA ligase subunit beta, partial [Patescibacteria group bacterium]|nr:phenylalanine--tRNA ligase subunit beta [Patescibacteria group bacterium]
IVCCAKNIEAGQKVPVAKVGTTVPVGKDGEPLKIERVKIREVESAGMLCSPKELGLGDDHSGILILDKDLKIGTPLTKALSLPETVLETEVTTNRGDELSIYGLAGEIAAITGNKHRPLITKESPVQITPAVKLTVSADPAFCRRYSAQVVTNLSLAPSPAFIQLRLRQAGMRPINNVVDITNYVMLLTGQPLHAFDYRKISRGEIIVRESRTGDRLTTLDGVTRQLGFGQIVISDPEKILGLGGVMGGEDSGVTNLTDTVVIESAVFDPVAIRQTTVKYNLRSEASFRFERGVEIGGTLRALNLAVELLQKYAGGKAASPVIDVYPQKYVPAHVTMTSSKLNQYLGYDYPLSQAEKILTGLGLLTASKTKDKLTVKVPSWRERDITIEEDLIEEVARIEGYDNIPSLMPSGEVPKTPPITNINLIQDIRGHLSSLGLTEVSVYPMISPDLNLEENALKISNSISGQWEYLRTSLIPGLAETSAKNINLGEEGPIFEIGKVYLPSDELPQEKEILALSAADFSLVKGYVQSVLEKLSLPSSKYKKGSSQLFTEDSTSFVEVNGTIAGQMGEITGAF